jgi:serine/threonine-protein kinase
MSDAPSQSTPGSDGTGRSRTVTVGRYLLHRQIARGGMATIHIARLMGDEGFSRIVAAKRLLPEFAEDTDFVAMFMDEARIASKVHHRNVVPVLDLVTTTDEVMLVQEYVHGVPLHILLRTAKHAKKHIPPKVAIGIAQQVAAGLHAAHDTSDEMGQPLNIVHRDVSPQNVMLATDGMARLLDFGVAKATMAAHVTRDGTFKGKLAYSSPEQLRGHATRQSDVYALAVVLWELLVGHRMHEKAQGEGELVTTIMAGSLPTVTEALAGEHEWGGLSEEHWKQLQAVEPLVKKGLAVDTNERYKTAAEFEEALSKLPSAGPTELGNWVKSLGKEFLEGRDKLLHEEEASWRRQQPAVRASTPASSTRPISVKIPPKSDKVATIPPLNKVAIPAKDAEPEITVSKASPAAMAKAVEPMTHPPAPREGGKGKTIAILAALIVILGIGLVFAMRGNDKETVAEPTAPVTPPPTVADPVPPPAPTQADPAPPAETAGTETVKEPATPDTATDPGEPTSTATAQVGGKRPVRERQRPAGREPKKKEEKAAKVPEKSGPTEKPAANCSPPYYFEGEKKIFKPECL